MVLSTEGDETHKPVLTNALRTLTEMTLCTKLIIMKKRCQFCIVFKLSK